MAHGLTTRRLTVAKTMIKLKGDVFLGEGRLSVSSDFFSQNNTMALDLIGDWISDLKKIRDVVHQAEYGGGPNNKEAEKSDGI